MMKIVTWLRQAITATFVIYGLAVTLFLAIYLLRRDGFVLVAQGQHVMHFITLVTLLMHIVGALIFVRKWMLVALLPGALAFIIWYGPSFLPRNEPDVEGVEITVATFNVLGDFTHDDDVFAVIDALDADVIAFQEIRPSLLTRLQAELREEYPYQISLEMRLAMISRYPMLESQTPSNQRFVRSVLEVQGQRVVVYSFHATIPLFEIRRTYNDDALSTNIRDMVSLIQHEVDPVILMCDCNSTPRTAQYAWLDAVLDDAHRARGRGFGLTFPANGDLASMPLIRIDYIWYSDHFTALDAKVGDDSGGSDHFPLWARLVLRAS